ILALAHAVALTSSHCPSSPSTLPPGILASRCSTTGWITVGEHVMPSPDGSTERDLTLRYLRADHSLLGGLWVGPSRDMLKMQYGVEPSSEETVRRAESIYSTFILQEAVRLVKPPEDVPHQTPEQGLIMCAPTDISTVHSGLGAGLSARALARHGVNLTLVEIDPAVHDFAERYFGVNEVKWGEVVLKDAVEWVEALVKETSLPDGFPPQPPAFDYIIHDVFTGGAVPATLFTSTFLAQLKSLLHHSGVLALNFAGTLSSRSSRSILSTLLSVFPHCRAFEDVPHTASGPAESTSDDSFRNMVILCSKEWYAPVELRDPVREDFLDYPSPMIRRSVFASFRQHEIDLTRFKPASGDHGVGTWLLRDRNDVRRVEAAQLDEVGMHWDAMEKVLPPEVWARW
ncbi:S-adenosyl-L-methionine-dependent methyltransferase, partial [Rhodotorula toruloides]